MPSPTPFELRQQATQQYRPDPVRVLFVAESPPAAPDRHFYFTNVPRVDTLWAELTRALYPADFGETRLERRHKQEWLHMFQQAGYWMIEAVQDPIDKNRREEQIAANMEYVMQLLHEAQPDHVILIAIPVWKVLQDPIRAAGFSLPQTQAIPFPGHGHQRRFRDVLSVVLPSLGIPDDRAGPVRDTSS